MDLVQKENFSNKIEKILKSIDEKIDKLNFEKYDEKIKNLENKYFILANKIDKNIFFTRLQYFGNLLNTISLIYLFVNF